jgi:hypothetical protein
MASSPTGPKNPAPEEGTRVDLGEDLVSAAPSLATPKSTHQAPPLRSLSVSEELESVRILLSEGLLEDARRTLFRILRLDPANSLARRFLEEIRDLEVKALLHSGGKTRATLTQVPRSSRVESTAVLERLDADWRLGMQPDPRDRQSCEKWLRKNIAAGAGTRELLDWAGALILMEQPELAAELLERQARASLDPQLRALLAQAHLLAGKPQEVRMICEAGLRDPGIAPEIRNELNYLRARALELLAERSEASAIYGALGSYRDSRFRLGELKS